jgi:hypothetical protein
MSTTRNETEPEVQLSLIADIKGVVKFVLAMTAKYVLPAAAAGYILAPSFDRVYGPALLDYFGPLAPFVDPYTYGIMYAAAFGMTVWVLNQYYL